MQVLIDINKTWKILRANHDNCLPFWRQMLEMIILYVFRNIGPGYYLQARWWEPRIPFKHKYLHFNKKEYHLFIDKWNSKPYQKLSQHKVVEKSILTLLHVPTPDFIGYLHAVSGVGYNGLALRTVDDLISICSNLIGQYICLKPVEGFGGAGFCAFRVIRQNGNLVFEHPFNGAITSISGWYEQSKTQKNGFIIESYLIQHPALAAINKSSVNTLRILICQKNGVVQIYGAYFRMGTQGSLVDNISCGGIYCPVDLKTGILQNAIHPSSPANSITHHPDTGAHIAGLQIPFWEECLALSGRALLAFPHMRFAGVDVAITELGPQMIELNVRPDQIGCAWIGLPLTSVEHWLTGD